MLTQAQFERSRNFIYRQGDLLTRRRFAYHFEGGRKAPLLAALACYQNSDGGFGNGLELDLLCPESSGICTETAFAYLLEWGVSEGTVFERALAWVLENQTETGDLPHPTTTLTRYPHGPWWAEGDKGRILSIAGLLGRMGVDNPEITSRARAVFETTYVPFPKALEIYAYPVSLFLEYARDVETCAPFREELRAAVPGMLEREAWHHPLFFCGDRWNAPHFSQALWRHEAERAVSTLQEDGGVQIERYAALPWWRPVWTLEMLIILKEQGLLEGIAGKA